MVKTFKNSDGTQVPYINQTKAVDSNAPTYQEKLSWIKEQSKITRKKLPINNITLGRADKALRSKKLPIGRDITINSTESYYQLIYGRARVGGTIFLSHIDANNQNLHLIIGICRHEIDELEKLYLNNIEIPFSAGFGNATGDYANKVFLKRAYGQDIQTPIPEAMAALPSYWTSSHRLRSIAHVYLRLTYNKDLFSEGIPKIEFLVRGKKVYDPRSNTIYWTSNAALCCADFLKDSIFGLGVDASEINNTSLSDAANICDEVVDSESRYTTNAYFTTQDSPENIIDDICSSYGGHVSRIGGKWEFYPAKWRSPTITLSEDDLRSIPVINLMRSKSDAFNTVKGQFVDASNNYDVVDYVPIEKSSAITEDGERLIEEINLPATTSHKAAQRLARIELERSRRQLRMSADFGLKAFKLSIGDTVNINLSRFGFVNKTFEIKEFSFEIRSGELLTTLSLKETDSNIYSDVAFTNLPSAPTTNLPNPLLVENIIGLVAESGTNHLYIRGDGTVFARMFLSWTAVTDAFVLEGGKIIVQYKLATSSTWQTGAVLDGNATSVYILDVADGQIYDIRVSATNGIGASGGYTIASHLVLGKTQPPANVTGFSSAFLNNSINLNWNLVSDLDLKEYEIRRGGSNWETATSIVKTKSLKFTDNFQGAGTTLYFIKAIDTSNNESISAGSTSVFIAAPNPVNNLTCDSVDNNVLLDWEVPSASAFPIDRYKIYKGATFGGAELIGTSDGTFESFFERIGGEYTYHVTAVDTAGNESIHASVSRVIYDPPDFVLQSDQILNTNSATLTNLKAIDSTTVLGLVNVTETWEAHFINNSWSTPQDQINAGYVYYSMPTASTASYVQEVDYLVPLPPSLCRFSVDTNFIIGTATFSYTIEYKLNIGDAYTSLSGNSVFIPSAFRYVRYTINLSASGGNDLVLLSNINPIIEVKKQKDSGNALSSASGFITINFEKDFISVKSIQITPSSISGSDRLTPIHKYDWSTPDVDQFDVKIVDENGTAVARYFSWEAEGIVRPPI